MTSHFRNGVQFAFDASTLKEVQACLRKYKYMYIDGWRKRGSNVHLKFGGWYASALEMYHKLLAMGMTSNEALIDVIDWTMKATWEYRLDDAGKPIPDSGAPWMGVGAKTRENLIRTIVWYVDEFESDDTIQTVILANGKPAVELSFQLEVDNGIVFAGHLDRLGTMGDMIVVEDNKTTESTLSPYYFERYSPDTQMLMYGFAGKALYQAPIGAVFVGAAQIAVGFTRFMRGPVLMSDAQLDEWYDGIMEDIVQVQTVTRRAVENATIIEGRMGLDDKYFRMNPASCFNFGGCPFRDVCSKTPAIRKTWLPSDFEKLPLWNPLEPR